MLEVALHASEADQGRAACAVAAMMCCVLIIHGRCAMYARKLEVVLYALEMLEGMRRLLICTLEAVECELCLLEVPEMIHRELLCMPEVVDGGLCLWRCWR